MKKKPYAYKFFFPFLEFGLVVLCHNANAYQFAVEQSKANTATNEHAAVKYLLPTLKRSQKVGRIYYTSNCQGDRNAFDSFPEINVESPSVGTTGLNAIQEIFKLDKYTNVTEIPFGIIRIYIGVMHTNSFLSTKISDIKFEPIEQYNPSLAIAAIENNTDVRAAMDRIGTHVASRVSNEAIAMPADGLPHLPSTIRNMTMDRALDLVAQSFRGVVVYGVCTNSKRYSIDFTGGDGFDESK